MSQPNKISANNLRALRRKHAKEMGVPQDFGRRRSITGIHVERYKNGSSSARASNSISMRNLIKTLDGGPDPIPKAAFKGYRHCKYCGWNIKATAFLNHARQTKKFTDGTAVCPGIRYGTPAAKAKTQKTKDDWKARKAAELAAALREIE